MTHELTDTDKKYLRRLDAAFDDKRDYQKWLAEQNVELSHAAQNWCKQAKEHYRGLCWWRASTIAVSTMFLVTWAAILWGVLHG